MFMQHNVSQPANARWLFDCLIAVCRMGSMMKIRMALLTRRK